MPRIFTEQQLNSTLTSIEGIWWISNKPEKKIFGILNFSPDKGATLDLRSHLTSDLVDTGEETIYGDCQGKIFTLFYAVQGRAQISFGGNTVQMSQEWLSNLVFEGVHVEHPDIMKFKKIEFQTQLLDQWVNYPKFSRERHEDRTSIHINNPPVLKFDWHQNTTGYIEFIIGDQSSNIDLNLTYFPFVRVDCPSGLEISEFHRNYLRPFLYFISLATTGTDYVYSTKAFLENNLNTSKDIQINIYSGYLMSNKPVQNIKSHKHWIKFNTNDDTALESLSRWFTLYGNNQDLLIEYFAIRYSDKSYLEDDYFRIFKVIESWIGTSRAVGEEKDFEEYTELLVRVKPNISSEDYEEISNKFLSVLNAGECVDHLISAQISEIKDLLKNWRNFRRLCANTRTKFAHIGSRKTEQTFDTEGQIVAKIALDLMFVSDLMRLLKLPEAEYLKCLELNEGWLYMNQYIGRMQIS